MGSRQEDLLWHHIAAGRQESLRRLLDPEYASQEFRVDNARSAGIESGRADLRPRVNQLSEDNEKLRVLIEIAFLALNRVKIGFAKKYLEVIFGELYKDASDEAIEKYKESLLEHYSTCMDDFFDEHNKLRDERILPRDYSS